MGARIGAFGELASQDSGPDRHASLCGQFGSLCGLEAMPSRWLSFLPMPSAWKCRYFYQYYPSVTVFKFSLIPEIRPRSPIVNSVFSRSSMRAKGACPSRFNQGSVPELCYPTMGSKADHGSTSKACAIVPLNAGDQERFAPACPARDAPCTGHFQDHMKSAAQARACAALHVLQTS